MWQWLSVARTNKVNENGGVAAVLQQLLLLCKQWHELHSKAKQ